MNANLGTVVPFISLRGSVLGWSSSVHKLEGKISHDRTQVEFLFLQLEIIGRKKNFSSTIPAVPDSEGIYCMCLKGQLNFQGR
jgi:hypothetical protein